MSQQASKVVIITGASQGIGEGLVRAYRDAGYRVVATSRTIEPSKDADIATVRGDIASAETATRIVQAALDRFGRIDTLVNNAGIFVAKPFTDFTAADYETNLATNLQGAFLLTQRAAGEMLKQGSGHIVNITAALAEQPRANVPAALASITKGALNALTKGLALEYAARGIRVNAVAPGVIETPMHDPKTHDFLAKLHPMGRLGVVKDVTDAVLYLENASFVTGAIVPVDGGMSAGVG